MYNIMTSSFFSFVKTIVRKRKKKLGWGWEVFTTGRTGALKS